jgi:hypothetical protein
VIGLVEWAEPFTTPRAAGATQVRVAAR